MVTTVLLIFILHLSPFFPQSSSKAKPNMYPVIKSDFNRVAPEDALCPYFARSKDWTTAWRVVFTYSTSPNSSDSDTPRLDHVTIVIDPSEKTPLARKTGTDDAGLVHWELHMDEGTYTSEAACLAGVQVKK